MNTQNQFCQSCKCFLQKNKWANHVLSELHRRNAIKPLDGRVNKISEGVKGRILYYMYVNDGSDLNLPESFLSEAGLSLLPHLSILLFVGKTTNMSPLYL